MMFTALIAQDENFQRNEFARYVDCLATYGEVLPLLRGGNFAKVCQNGRNCFRLFDVQKMELTN